MKAKNVGELFQAFQLSMLAAYASYHMFRSLGGALQQLGGCLLRLDQIRRTPQSFVAHVALCAFRPNYPSPIRHDKVSTSRNATGSRGSIFFRPGPNASSFEVDGSTEPRWECGAAQTCVDYSEHPRCRFRVVFFFHSPASCAEAKVRIRAMLLRPTARVCG